MQAQKYVKSKFIMIFFFIQFFTVVSAFSQPLNFRAHLSGDKQAIPVETMAKGQAIFQLSADGTELYFKVIVAKIENVVGAHIHLAPPGENGPIVLPLLGIPFIPDQDAITDNGVLVEGTATVADLMGPFSGDWGALINAMLNGNTYVNVHTIQYRPGEIRGQIF